MNNDEIQSSIRTVWEYMQMHQPVRPADAIIVLGSRDDRVANYAAKLMHQNIAPLCVVTGGVAHGHDLLATTWQAETEADHFISIMLAAGINQSRIYREPHATNTGQNATLSYELLVSNNIQPKSILIVTKPYMERRALATFQAQWPDPAVSQRVSSVGGSIEEYCNEAQDFETVVNIMVGDLQRIMEYPKRGLSAVQQIPVEVVAAFDVLCQAGYTKHLLRK